MSLRSIFDVAAPAKLNLFLHVTGRRADGYHLLQSLFTLVDWSDSLHFEVRDDGRIARHDLGWTLPADDLSLRAARLLQAESATSLGAGSTRAGTNPAAQAICQTTTMASGTIHWTKPSARGNRRPRTRGRLSIRLIIAMP